MGYPTSVFSPAARSNGQTIDASHVNDVQAEITAMENALLGTITHSVNVSGASTLASLQCAASTFASANLTQSTITNAQIANSTFSVRPVTPPPHAAKVFMTSSGAIGSSANSTLSFVEQAYLTNSSMHSTATNPERLTPKSTGIYQISAQVQTETPSSGVRVITILDSSNADVARQRITNSTSELTLNVTGYKRFDVLGGYVTVQFKTDGSSHSVSSGINNTWFAMHKL